MSMSQIFLPAAVRSCAPVGVVFVLLLICLPGPAAAVELPLRDGENVSVPWEGAIGVPERLAELMGENHSTHGHQHPFVMHPLGLRDLQNLPSSPESPDTAV